MRRSALPIMAAMSLALLLPQQFQASAQELPPSAPLAHGEIENIGPGTYQSRDDSYQIAENDVPAGLMSRTHTVVGRAQGVSQAQDAPETRSDLGVFGPSWEAEFLGGQLKRKLVQESGAITTIDLASSESVRYDLTESMDGPGGGSINTYKATDGSTLVENVAWDDLAGETKSTVTETLNIDLASAASGDDVPVGADGNPIKAADLKPTYTWKQVSGTGDTWRVTSMGNTATKASTVSYDGQGRVATVTEPARGENPEQSLSVAYATATTASGEALGDVAGQVKDITVTTGQTVQTLARYAYDTDGLLRKVTNPAEGTDLNSYTYDGDDRVATATSDNGARWELTFAGDAAQPQAQETTGNVPEPGSALEGAPSLAIPEGISPAAEDFRGEAITDPQAYPRNCSTPQAWMWYQASNCATKVAHYGWKNPYWKRTPTGAYIVGVNGDHCTQALDVPNGWDFRAACDSHDYGYGTIGNAYKGYGYYLDTNKGIATDVAFHDILRYNTCSAYWFTSACRATARTYYNFVLAFGHPYNGAKETR